MDGRKGRKNFLKKGGRQREAEKKKERRGVRKARKSDSHCLSLRVIVLCKYLLITVKFCAVLPSFREPSEPF